MRKIHQNFCFQCFFLHELCGHFQECCCSSGSRIPERRPVNEMKACLKCSDRLDGQIQGERESAVKSYTHARRWGGWGWEGRGGGGQGGRDGRKESEEVLREETHPLCCGGRHGCAALGRCCCRRLLPGLETVTVAQRCGFTRSSSGSSSFPVLVSLTEIPFWRLTDIHCQAGCWRGACARREHVKSRPALL